MSANIVISSVLRVLQQTPALHRAVSVTSSVNKTLVSWHITPTGSSWMDLVERWFAALTEKEPRRVIGSLTEDTQAAH